MIITVLQESNLKTWNIAVWWRIQKSCHGKTQQATGKFRKEVSSTSAGIKLMNRKNIFPKDINYQNVPNRNLELKNSINEMEKTLESIVNRADLMEERIRELEDKNTEMIQVEEERELSFFLMKKSCKNYSNPLGKAT